MNLESIPRASKLFLIFLFLYLPSLTFGTKLLEYCSPPGPHIPYVSAKTLRNSPAVQKRFAELTALLEKISNEAADPLIYDYKGAIVGGVNLAVSITTPTETVYTFNHGLETEEGNSPWTEHTVFRVASVSKAITVWEIIRMGIGWDEKVARFLPELLEGRYKKEWSEVTVGALAGYVGGAIRDFEHDISLRPEHVPTKLYKRDGPGERRNYYFVPEDIFENVLDLDGYVESIWASYLADFHPEEAWKMGFPPMDDVDHDRCLFNCTRSDVLHTLANHPLVYPAFTSPAYSNVGFILLGLILERKSGLPFDDLMQRDLYGPLGMKDTFHKLPWDAQYKPTGWGAHPFWGANDTWFETREIWGDWGVPAGGIFTSAHDLSIFLRSILAAFPYATDSTSFVNKHTILPADKVREWLTPTAFTGGKSLLGRPWEIKRKKYSGCHGARPVTLYSKAGGGTGYNAGITIIPEYGIGLTVLVAGDGGLFRADGKRYTFHWAPIRRLILESQNLLQTIEQAAYEEAGKAYIGEYLFNSFIIDGDDGFGKPLGPTNIPGPIFSGIEVIQDNGPGLRIKRWISNGTDFLQTLVTVKMQMSTKGVDGAVAVARLYPVGNVKTRGPRKWAEDWRVWFEWEWENLEEQTVQPQPETTYAPRPAQMPYFQRPWSKSKERVPAPPKLHIPVDRDHSWRVWPEVLPGVSKKGTWKGGVIRNPNDGDKPPSPEEGEQNKPADDEQSEERGEKQERKGWARPTKSSATVTSSDENAKSWSNKPRPPWWRAKFDKNESLRNYAAKKQLANDNYEVEEYEADDADESRRGNGKTDKVFHYTLKTSEAHGMSPDDKAEDYEDDSDYDDGYNTLVMHRTGRDMEGQDGVSGVNGFGYMDPDDDDDEEFYVPDYPPHYPPVPFTVEELGTEETLGFSRPADNFVQDEYFLTSHGGGHYQDPFSMQSPVDQQQWDYWKEDEARKRKQQKRENKRWPCGDYNGIEMQAWAGWSLGLVRFIREGLERRVVSIEVPALKVRLAKVGTYSGESGRSPEHVRGPPPLHPQRAKGAFWRGRSGNDIDEL
ncbi:hypothetical protein BDZ91DRAFT_796293 [Kalaharituber pfeilii]|nr:hypothetical protein BDZ91DRAFT_796293 [Kalaharituber pfeilii]